MLGLIAAAVVIAGSVQDPEPAPLMANPSEIRVDDVVVTGRSLDTAVQRFVGEVADPVGRRGLARWNHRVCVGVVNLDREPAQYIVDRVSTVAGDLGIEVGEPGCRANVVIVATNDGAAAATAMVDSRRAAFVTGASGTDQGYSALRRFKESDRPVRWWQVSLPMDNKTNTRAVRFPGDLQPTRDGDPTSILASAPVVNVDSPSRIRSQVRDDLVQSIIVVDVEDLGNVTLVQLADYLAFVALAQVDPEAETAGFNTVLNVFDDPSSASGLTGWDVAYLQGLYALFTERVHTSSQRRALTQVVYDARKRAAETSQD